MDQLPAEIIAYIYEINKNWLPNANVCKYIYESAMGNPNYRNFLEHRRKMHKVILKIKSISYEIHAPIRKTTRYFNKERKVIHCEIESLTEKSTRYDGRYNTTYEHNFRTDMHNLCPSCGVQAILYIQITKPYKHTHHLIKIKGFGFKHLYAPKNLDRTILDESAIFTYVLAIAPAKYIREIQISNTMVNPGNSVFSAI